MPDENRVWLGYIMAAENGKDAGISFMMRWRQKGDCVQPAGGVADRLLGRENRRRIA